MTIYFGDSTSIASGGSLGKILDFQQYQTTGTLSTTARDFTDTTNFTVTLTPQTNSKVFISFFATMGKDDTSGLKFRLARVKSGTTTYIGISDSTDWRSRRPSMVSYIGASDTSNQVYNMGFQWVDTSPGGNGSTSIVYKLQWTINGGTGYIGRDSTGSVSSYGGANQFTAMEIGA